MYLENSRMFFGELYSGMIDVEFIQSSRTLFEVGCHQHTINKLILYNQEMR